MYMCLLTTTTTTKGQYDTQEASSEQIDFGPHNFFEKLKKKIKVNIYSA